MAKEIRKPLLLTKNNTHRCPQCGEDDTLESYGGGQNLRCRMCGTTYIEPLKYNINTKGTRNV